MEKRCLWKGKGSSGEEKMLGGSVPQEGKRCLDDSREEKVPQCLGRGRCLRASVPLEGKRCISATGASVLQEGKSCLGGLGVEKVPQ